MFTSRDEVDVSIEEVLIVLKLMEYENQKAFYESSVFNGAPTQL
jgi:hypothetical protein